MTFLLDANVLIALTTADHVHQEAAHRWWAASRVQRMATCPITEGALVRIAVHAGRPVSEPISVLQALSSSAVHEFWPDDLPFLDVELRGVVGHRQVTDAYLAALARHRGGTLATFDRGLAALHPDVAHLVPTG